MGIVGVFLSLNPSRPLGLNNQGPGLTLGWCQVGYSELGLVTDSKVAGSNVGLVRNCYTYVHIYPATNTWFAGVIEV
jgi:hypothetical protein